MQTFLVRHDMSCPNDGLVFTRHNKIHDTWWYHTPHKASVISYLCTRKKPHPPRSEEEVRHRVSTPETRGDLSIRGLLESVMEAIIYVRFGGDDTYSWKPLRMDKLLSGSEKI